MWSGRWAAVSVHWSSTPLATAGRLTALLSGALLCARAGVDPDLWGHVRFGTDILKSGRIATLDPYSFTQDVPWTNHEWLSELVFAIAYRAGGVTGLALLKALLLALTLRVVWSILVPVADPAVRWWLFAVIPFALTPAATTFRPQLWTLPVDSVDLHGVGESARWLDRRARGLDCVAGWAGTGRRTASRMDAVWNSSRDERVCHPHQSLRSRPLGVPCQDGPHDARDHGVAPALVASGAVARRALDDHLRGPRRDRGQVRTTSDVVFPAPGCRSLPCGGIRRPPGPPLRTRLATHMAKRLVRHRSGAVTASHNACASAGVDGRCRHRRCRVGDRHDDGGTVSGGDRQLGTGSVGSECARCVIGEWASRLAVRLG